MTELCPIKLMEETYIESQQNSHVKNLVKLRERKHRNRQERFIIEGLREIKHAFDSDFGLLTLYFCPELFPSESHEHFVQQLRSEKAAPLVRMHPSAFSKASLREGPDGLIAIAEPQDTALDTLALKEKSTVLVLEGIEKPGNLGAIIRSADGAGVSAIFMVNCQIDSYNPNAIRASQGLVFRIPIIAIETDAIFQWLEDHQFQTIATSPDASSLYNEVKYAERTALFMGSESTGLSEACLSKVSQTITIPMQGHADSLNVSVATAICLYQINQKID